jgi:hypothetical protein
MGARLQMSKKEKNRALEKRSKQKTTRQVDWVLAFEWAKTGYDGP